MRCKLVPPQRLNPAAASTPDSAPSQTARARNSYPSIVQFQLLLHTHIHTVLRFARSKLLTHARGLLPEQLSRCITEQQRRPEKETSRIHHWTNTPLHQCQRAVQLYRSTPGRYTNVGPRARRSVRLAPLPSGPHPPPLATPSRPRLLVVVSTYP